MSVSVMIPHRLRVVMRRLQWLPSKPFSRVSLVVLVGLVIVVIFRVFLRGPTTPSLLLVDNMTRGRLADAVERVYNLPWRYGQEQPPPLAGGGGCGRYPQLVDLSFNNLYWQLLHSSNGTFYLYSAFFDNRSLTVPTASVRILAMMDRIQPAVTVHCQLWYAGEAAPVIAKVTEYRYIWEPFWGNYRNGILQPYLLQCVVPVSHRHHLPLSVSLVEEKCDTAINNLRVIHNLPLKGEGKKDFAVCVKGMVFHSDVSLRVVEWLELLILLGADKVFLYDLGIHPNITKVLQYYEAQGRVDMKKLTLPGYQPNAQGLVLPYFRAKYLNQWQNELIPYNDCFYRNMNLYRLIAVFDIDEVIMPRKTRSWRELIQKLAPEVLAGKGHPHSAYFASNVYFLDGMQKAHGWAPDVPLFMHMLQHVYRAKNYTRSLALGKSFHDPQRVLTVHNHYPLSCLPNGCQSLDMPVEEVHMQHYRQDCGDSLRHLCPYYRKHNVRDDAILRLKKPLLDRTLHTLRRLGFLQDGPR